MTARSIFSATRVVACALLVPFAAGAQAPSAAFGGEVPKPEAPQPGTTHSDEQPSSPATRPARAQAPEVKPTRAPAPAHGAEGAPDYPPPSYPPPPGYAYPPYPPPGYSPYPPPGYSPYPPPGYSPYPPPGYSPYPPPGYSPYPPPGYSAYPPPGNAQYPQRGYELAPPPPDPTIHLHDSFYLRMTLGGGYVYAVQSFEPNPVAPVLSSAAPISSTDIRVSGGTTSFDFMLGGTPAPGFTLGGGLFMNVAPSPDVKVADVSTNSKSDLTLFLLAMFADVFPKPSGGFHFGGIAGVASIDWSGAGTGAGGSASGIGGGVLAGYDAWIGKQWSMGGLVRVVGASAFHDSFSGHAKYGIFNVAVMGTALYQ